MPWLFNPQNMAQTLTMRNGLTLRLPARKKHYLAPELMSGDIQDKARRQLIRNLGGDPVVKEREVKSDTSSSHHQARDMVGAVSGENGATAPKSKRSAKKRTTAKSASTGKKKKSG